MRDPKGNAFWFAAIAVYKVASVAIAAYDTYQTVKALANGEMTAGQLAKTVAIDAVVGATVGKGAAKLLKQCSFDGATLVATQEGLFQIQNIRPGMSVLSGDPVSGETSYQTVLDQYSNSYDKTVYITYAGEAGNEQITSNTIHPFFVVFADGELRLTPQASEGHVYEGPIKGGAWVDAAHLRPGNHLRGPDGTLREVLAVEIVDKPLTAYNLSVTQTETFFVGRDGVWVHNCRIPKKPVETYDVGEYNDLKSSAQVGDNLEHHHVGQQAKMGELVEGYDYGSAPAIELPKSEHAAVTAAQRARGNAPAATARDQLAQDARDLRNETNAPNSSIQEVIDKSKDKYPETRRDQRDRGR
nr:polymorphic toxin-type HINT domain-containing protein [Celeribacter baekdonensis]